MITTSELSALNIVELLAKRFPQVDFSGEFLAFLHAQEANDHQLCRIASGETLIEFFDAQQVPAFQSRAFLSPDSRLNLNLDYHALIRLAPEEAFAFLLDRLSTLFDLQQVALDSENHTGFNRHGREHVATVARKALVLMNDLQPSSSQVSRDQIETLLGGLLHDIGNLLSRKYHGLYGIYLFTQMFKNFAIDEATLESFLNVLEITLFHEVEFGSRLPTLAQLRPSALSVIVGDKTDVSFRRVSSKSNVPEAVEDIHVLVNLLVANSTIERTKDPCCRFRWTVNYKAKYDATQSSVFSSLLKATGRVKYPKEWETLYGEANIEYLFVFSSTFLNVYLSRLYFAMRAAFALYPSVEQFELIIDDQERGVSLIRTFARHDYVDKVFTLGKLFYKQAWQDTYLYTALKQQSQEV
ncbi:MAG TPA: hypothetical protein VMT34_14410 [Aggregatilineales bacterium]|nr:hypothetical protein [Aggregatilineales bacterium]